MAPRKGKNKMNDHCETSAAAAANKRMRTNILNRTHGVPFTNPFNQFPSLHLLQQQQQRNTTTVTDLNLRLAPPSPYRPEEVAVDDSFISALMPQQNFIINYHMNLMVQSVEDLWRRTLSEECKKRKEMEGRLKDKEEQVELFRKLYQHYEEKTFCLENNIGQRGLAGEASGVAPQEDAQSCYVDLNRGQRTGDVIKCKHCESRAATMLFTITNISLNYFT